MHSILLLNAKGGCGKTTLATNIAAYYALQGKRVVLADFDPQASSMDWLGARPADRPRIRGLAAWQNTIRVPKKTDYLIIDSPAAVSGKPLATLVKQADSILIPILPSPIDIRAAEHFIGHLNALRRVMNKKVKLATVANRVRENTLAAGDLDNYLETVKLPSGKKVPYLALLRASQNYIRAAESGLSIFEFAPAKTLPDREHWERIFRWLDSKRSRPAA
ncbi:MAG: ParA family protein [Gammaproteobacteria bacterium]|nr:ParA family protein [Gammaproteobacteria bacterium]MBQ0838483.1 ParA family protein [Gammaproteobacteria bacterium]